MSQKDPSVMECNAYAENFILHGDMAKAFDAAFPASKASQKSKYEKASSLHKTVKIQSRISELRDVAKTYQEDGFKITFAEKQKMLVKAYQIGLKAENASGMCNAVDKLCKMDGDYNSGNIPATKRPVILQLDQNDLLA